MLISIALATLLMAAGEVPVQVTGFCERAGETFSFVDAIAFDDARDKKGVVTTTLYLVSAPLDREALAGCLNCSRPLLEKPTRSVRREAVEAQARAAGAGWLQARYFGGQGATVFVMDIARGRADGGATSIMAGNEKVQATLRDADRHLAGKVLSDAGFGNRCEAVFDVKVGWPKAE